MKLKAKNMLCLLYRNVANDVFFQKHFTDFNYLQHLLRNEQFCEPWYLKTRVHENSPAASFCRFTLIRERKQKLITFLQTSQRIIISFPLHTQPAGRQNKNIVSIILTFSLVIDYF